jgi:hypothetical protein
VQLARLSLWLATLAADRPLTFLDHHLACGNSLVGATFDDIARQPAGGRTRRPSTLPLLEGVDFWSAVAPAVRAREVMALTPDDSAAVVHGKERQLAAVHDPGSPLGRWKRVMDVWCAGWFRAGGSFDRGVSAELMQSVLTGTTSLPARIVERLLADVEAAAGSHRFFHWPTAFPEVFAAGSGGFDAVLGNPPWDMVRGDSGEAGVREGRREDARQLMAFARTGGVYRVASRAHVNRYALFVERALQLARSGGRVGLVLPAGVITDVGSAPLRRFLFDRAAIDRVVGMDNRTGIFPIHRSVRFVLVSGSAGAPTAETRCRFGVSTIDDLELPSPHASELRVTRALLARISGHDDMGIPELRSELDLRIVERISAAHPCAGDSGGWRLQFGRELNASDDRGQFVPFDATASSRPVLEGKMIEPFAADVGKARQQLRPDARCRIPRRARLAYRDVAGATNRLTLIAAIVPARAVTTHTLFCLKTPLSLDAQQVLCALFNSFVANYLVRLRVNTHVTAALIARLRLPVVPEGSAAFQRLATLSKELTAAGAHAERTKQYVEMQALAAACYGLTAKELEHILGTFPLIPGDTRARVLETFSEAGATGTRRPGRL